jgi:glycerol uptake facilitator-like aquaporin
MRGVCSCNSARDNRCAHCVWSTPSCAANPASTSAFSVACSLPFMAMRLIFLQLPGVLLGQVVYIAITSPPFCEAFPSVKYDWTWKLVKPQFSFHCRKGTETTILKRIQSSSLRSMAYTCSPSAC